MQELNKCKTELQFWRSKSHVLAGAAISGAIPGGSSSAAVTAAAAAVCLACGGGGGATEDGAPESGLQLPENGAAAESASVASGSSDTLSAELRALANQGVFPDLGGGHAATRDPEDGEGADQVRTKARTRLDSNELVDTPVLTFHHVWPILK